MNIVKESKKDGLLEKQKPLHVGRFPIVVKVNFG